VENQPCLWNYTHPGYSKKEEVQRAWQQVANEIKDSGKLVLQKENQKKQMIFRMILLLLRRQLRAHFAVRVCVCL